MDAATLRWFVIEAKVARGQARLEKWYPAMYAIEEDRIE
jgi:hypothetical protein